MSDACTEARDALAVEPPDDAARARIAAHRGRCAECREFARAVDGARAAALAFGSVPLDDLARTRIAARLAPAFDEAATRLGRRARPRPLTWLWAAAGAVAVAALCLVLLRGQLRSLVPVDGALRPYVVSGVGAARLAPFVGRPVDRLEVADGAQVRATLGAGARLTLVGPAHARVVRAAVERIVVRLERGLLVGDYDHAAGGTLEIQAPGATAIVVGTRFAVEVAADGVRVGVASGVVRVRGPDGEHWLDGDPAARRRARRGGGGERERGPRSGTGGGAAAVGRGPDRADCAGARAALARRGDRAAPGGGDAL
jgi:hypothetical protein